MSAISEFPHPKTRKQLQSLFGLVAQFHSWAPDVATATKHMRKLLSAKVSFQWSQECEEEFTALKKILTSPLFLRTFDSTLETTFSVDTLNLEGTGFLLSQEDKEGKTRVVRCGSVAAKKSCKSLSPIEAEAVGICWSAKITQLLPLWRPQGPLYHRPLPPTDLDDRPPWIAVPENAPCPPRAPPLLHRVHLGAQASPSDLRRLGPAPSLSILEEPARTHVKPHRRPTNRSCHIQCDGSRWLPRYRSHGQGQSSHQVRPKLPGYSREGGQGVKKGNRQPPKSSSCPRAPINLGIMLQGHSRKGRRIGASHPGGQHPPLCPHLQESISPIPPPPVTYRDKQDHWSGKTFVFLAGHEGADCKDDLCLWHLHQIPTLQAPNRRSRESIPINTPSTQSLPRFIFLQLKPIQHSRGWSTWDIFGSSASRAPPPLTSSPSTWVPYSSRLGCQATFCTDDGGSMRGRFEM